MGNRIRQAAALGILVVMAGLWIGGCAGYSDGTSTSQPAGAPAATTPAPSTPAPMNADTPAKDTIK